MTSALHPPLSGRLRFKLGRFVRQNPQRLLKAVTGHGLKISSVVHAGAHLAQERFYYESLGANRVLWIEGSASTYARLEASLEEDRKAGMLTAEHKAVNALLFAEDDVQMTLHGFSNDGESNSVLRATKGFTDRWPGIGETGSGETLASSTLDRVIAQHLPGGADLLVLDLQGAEIEVLKGASAAIHRAKAVICEVSKIAIYEGGALYPEVVAFFAAHGFVDMHRPHTCGDLLFLRREMMEA